MAEELEKTCENCEYENEDIEGSHCRHCIHNAVEHFTPKINHEKEIRAKAIDEFITAYERYCEEHYGDVAEQEISDMKKVAEQIKGGANNG